MWSDKLSSDKLSNGRAPPKTEDSASTEVKNNNLSESKSSETFPFPSAVTPDRLDALSNASGRNLESLEELRWMRITLENNLLPPEVTNFRESIIQAEQKHKYYKLKAGLTELKEIFKEMELDIELVYRPETFYIHFSSPKEISADKRNKLYGISSLVHSHMPFRIVSNVRSEADGTYTWKMVRNVFLDDLSNSISGFINIRFFCRIILGLEVKIDFLPDHPKEVVLDFRNAKLDFIPYCFEGYRLQITQLIEKLSVKIKLMGCSVDAGATKLAISRDDFLKLNSNNLKGIFDAVIADVTAEFQNFVERSKNKAKIKKDANYKEYKRIYDHVTKIYQLGGKLITPSVLHYLPVEKHKITLFFGLGLFERKLVKLDYLVREAILSKNKDAYFEEDHWFGRCFSISDFLSINFNQIFARIAYLGDLKRKHLFMGKIENGFQQRYDLNVRVFYDPKNDNEFAQIEFPASRMEVIKESNSYKIALGDFFKETKNMFKKIGFKKGRLPITLRGKIIYFSRQAFDVFNAKRRTDVCKYSIFLDIPDQLIARIKDVDSANANKKREDKQQKKDDLPDQLTLKQVEPQKDQMLQANKVEDEKREEVDSNRRDYPVKKSSKAKLAFEQSVRLKKIADNRQKREDEEKNRKEKNEAKAKEEEKQLLLIDKIEILITQLQNERFASQLSKLPSYLRRGEYPLLVQRIIAITTYCYFKLFRQDGEKEDAECALKITLLMAAQLYDKRNQLYHLKFNLPGKKDKEILEGHVFPFLADCAREADDANFCSESILAVENVKKYRAFCGRLNPFWPKEAPEAAPPGGAPIALVGDFPEEPEDSQEEEGVPDPSGAIPRNQK